MGNNYYGSKPYTCTYNFKKASVPQKEQTEPTPMVQDEIELNNIAYKKAKNVALKIGLLAKELSQKRDIVVINNYLSQITRSSSSIMANIAEASYIYTQQKQRAHYFRISAREANETISWVHLLYNMGEIDSRTCSEHVNELHDIIRILSKSIITISHK